MYLPNLKFVALPVPEIGALKKFGQSMDIRPKFFMRFCSDGPVNVSAKLRQTDRQTDRRHAISVYHAMHFASRGKKQHTISLMIPSHIKRITPCREGPLVRRSYNTLGTKLVTCRSSVDSQSLTLKFV